MFFGRCRVDKHLMIPTTILSTRRNLHGSRSSSSRRGRVVPLTPARNRVAPLRPVRNREVGRPSPGAFDGLPGLPPKNVTPRVRPAVRPRRPRTPEAAPRRLRRSLKAHLFALLWLVLLSGACFALLKSPAMYLNRYEVRGAINLSREEVIRAAETPLGTHLLNIDTERARERIAALPKVKEARVLRQFPSTMVIEIVERTPVALVPYQDGFVRVSAEGVQIEHTKPEGELDLPVLTGIPLPVYEPGKALAGEGWAKLIAIAAALGDAVGPDVSEIHVEESGDITMYTVDGVKVILGDNIDGLSARLASLPLVLQDVRENSLQVVHIDLRCEGRPAVRIKQPEKKRETHGGVE